MLCKITYKTKERKATIATNMDQSCNTGCPQKKNGVQLQISIIQR